MPDELLDVVNDLDVVTAQVLRSLVHEEGLQHRGVHVFLFTHDGNLLIQKRSADRAAAPSLLDCSVSEHVKAGEGYLDAAIRGMKEEMGVQGIDLKPIIKFKMNYGPNDNEISLLYKGRVDPADVRYDPSEIESIHYYRLEQVNGMINHDKSRFCGWFVEILNWYHGKPAKLKVLAVY